MESLPSSLPLAAADAVLVSVSSRFNFVAGALVFPKDLKISEGSFLNVGFFSEGFFSTGLGCVVGFDSAFGGALLLDEGLSGAVAGLFSGFLGSGL